MRRATLPQGGLGPFVNDEYSDVSFALYALKGTGMPKRELVRQAETIRQDLLHVPGVKKINIWVNSPNRSLLSSPIRSSRRLVFRRRMSRPRCSAATP